MVKTIFSYQTKTNLAICVKFSDVFQISEMCRSIMKSRTIVAMQTLSISSSSASGVCSKPRNQYILALVVKSYLQILLLL